MNDFRPRSTILSQSGLTLIELIAVIALVAVMTGLLASKFDLINPLKSRAEVRALADTIELVAATARDSDSALRIVLNREKNTYFVRSELALSEKQVNSRKATASTSKLSGFKTKGELSRNLEEQNKDLVSIDQQLEDEESRDGEPLETQFYANNLHSSGDDIRLGVPVDFPSLANERQLANPLRFGEYEGTGQQPDSPIVVLRFIGRRSAPTFRLVLIQGDATHELSFEPISGKVLIDQDSPVGAFVPDRREPL